MTHDEIISMAREAGAGEPESLYGRTDYVVMTRHDLERFVALVEQATLERAAQLLEAGVLGHGECAEAIRGMK